MGRHNVRWVREPHAVRSELDAVGTRVEALARSSFKVAVPL